MRAFGGLDVLVSCLEIFDYYRSIEDLDADLIDRAFDEMRSVNGKPLRQAALPGAAGGRPDFDELTESTSGYYPGRGVVLCVGSNSPSAGW